MINLKGYNFLFGKKAVSPVIGTILMVAVTVIMAAIVGGFVYQTARPKLPPSISTSLADEALEAVGTDNSTVRGGAATRTATPYSSNTSSTIGNRVAKLYFEGGQNIAIAELSALVTYSTNSSAPVEKTAILDGVYWSDNLSGTGPTKRGVSQGNLMAIGNAATGLFLVWADNDSSGDITPGDRLDFYEVDGKTGGSDVAPRRDFTVKILHKATQAFVADHTIRVY